MRPAVALLVSLSACGASLGDGGGDGHADAQQGHPDGKIYRDAGIDAPRVCVGGTPAQLAPDGSCFGLITTKMTYVQARAACAALASGGHLAYLKTAELDTAAEDFIGAVDTWIGGNDMAVEMSFVWDDNTPFSFTNWHTGEPNNGGTGATYQEDCVIIAGSRVGKQWDDRPCDATEVATSGMFASICQY